VKRGGVSAMPVAVSPRRPYSPAHKNNQIDIASKGGVQWHFD
jgi:hypothetical protein